MTGTQYWSVLGSSKRSASPRSPLPFSGTSWVVVATAKPAAIAAQMTGFRAAGAWSATAIAAATTVSSMTDTSGPTPATAARMSGPAKTIPATAAVAAAPRPSATSERRIPALPLCRGAPRPRSRRNARRESRSAGRARPSSWPAAEPGRHPWRAPGSRARPRSAGPGRRRSRWRPRETRSRGGRASRRRGRGRRRRSGGASADAHGSGPGSGASPPEAPPATTARTQATSGRTITVARASPSRASDVVIANVRSAHGTVAPADRRREAANADGDEQRRRQDEARQCLTGRQPDGRGDRPEQGRVAEEDPRRAVDRRLRIGQLGQRPERPEVLRRRDVIRQDIDERHDRRRELEEHRRGPRGDQEHPERGQSGHGRPGGLGNNWPKQGHASAQDCDVESREASAD